MNDDVVTKYALQNEIPSATILNSIDVVLETKALARLAGHKFITNAVQSFRNKYPDWKLGFTELLNELGSNYKTKKKKLSKNKTSNVKTKRKSEIIEKNNKKVLDVEDQSELGKSTESEERDDNFESDSKKSSNVTLEETQTEVSPVKKRLSIENNIINEEVQNNKLNSVISKKKMIDPEKKTCLSKCDSINQLIPEEINVLNIDILDVPILKINTQLSNLNLSTNTSINDNVETNTFKRKAKKNISNKTGFKRKCMSDDVKPICETVDSFFMTADNKDYMSVYKPPPAEEKNIIEHPKLESQKPKEIFIKGKKLIIGKKNNTGNRRERRQQVEETLDTVLHPSWEAKRKQKSLVKFEGKKITFNDQE